MVCELADGWGWCSAGLGVRAVAYRARSGSAQDRARPGKDALGMINSANFALTDLSWRSSWLHGYLQVGDLSDPEEVLTLGPRPERAGTRGLEPVRIIFYVCLGRGGYQRRRC